MKSMSSGYLLRATAAVSVVGFFMAAGFMLGRPQIPGNLGGIERYQAHVATDKPIYRTGEKVYVRGVVLRAEGHSPMASSPGSTGTASFEIKGPKGDTVASGASAIIDSVAGFSWDIPASQAGGEYTVRIFQASGGLASPPAERKFDIRAYRAPRLKSQIVFVRDGYGPGDTVAATLHVERAEGGDLIAGLPNRVYIEGRTPAQKPADMAGIIVNAVGKQVAKFRSEHEGRG